MGTLLGLVWSSDSVRISLLKFVTFALCIPERRTLKDPEFSQSPSGVQITAVSRAAADALGVFL